MPSKRKIENSIICVLCLENIETETDNNTTNNLVCTLSCDHIFHTLCILKSIIYSNKCPICRVAIQGCNHITGTVSEIIQTHNNMEFIDFLLTTLGDLNRQNEELSTRAQLQTEQILLLRDQLTLIFSASTINLIRMS